MKLDSPNSIFNMGDTSIRVKQLVEVNKLILKHISEYMSGGFVWERNTILQEDFYKSFIDEIARLEMEEGVELFSDFKRAKNYTVNTKRLGLRGRTLTNALMKTGLISSERKVSAVGKAYLENRSRLLLFTLFLRNKYLLSFLTMFSCTDKIDLGVWCSGST